MLSIQKGVYFIVVLIAFPWYVITFPSVSYVCGHLCVLFYEGLSSILLIDCSLFFLICWHSLHILDVCLIREKNYKHLLLS